MMVDHPGCVVECRKSSHDDVSVVENELPEISKQQIHSQVLETLEACRNAWSPANRHAHCQVNVCRLIPLHAGFGSGTQLRLAVARGWRITHDLDAGTPEELARVCGRGKRSTIGLWGFEWGGFLVDAGQRMSGEMGDLALRVEFPPEWHVLLMTPPTDKAICGSREDSWMAQLAPMPEEHSGEHSRIVLTEILPALRGRVILDFRSALQAFGDKVGDFFAQVQGGRFSHSQSAEIVEHLQQIGINGVVQSSWGPTLCAFFEDAQSAESAHEAMRNQYSNMTIALSSARNYGADIELR